MACNSIVSLDGQTGPCKIEMDVLSELKTLCKDSTHTSMLMDLSKTLNTKCLLVVESEPDAKVLKAWIKNLHPGTSIEDKFVTYSCGGRPKVDNIVRLVSALDSLFPGKAKQICVRIFILVDRDYRSDKALQKEQERLQDETKGYSKKFKIKLYCYKKNEQENYLLSARALKSWRDKKKRKKKEKTKMKSLEETQEELGQMKSLEETQEELGQMKSLEETQEELGHYINEHFEYLTIEKDYRSSLDLALKQESKDQQDISKHHRSSEDEIGKWQKDLRPSFTNAKQVLKKFGITGVPQYKELIKEFHEDDIDPEIKEDLVKGFLQFFDIEPTAPAATPQEEIDQPQPQPEIELPLSDNQGMQDGSASTDDDDSNPVECPKILSSRLDNGKSCCLHVIRVELASLFLRVASEWIWFKLSSP
ncbi:PREDICTED: uncharacterized protein LOC109476532 [Branchiostoma belcheri]|uniref:Uncharacterized protein LOC109476532 n=1 Tax=Branchiostoma belcheri TaxID=7741 RepID=A0A6P4ZGE8_BRABE|nr:PREDICTED: uncharacterized protein LOC109476532 [Branchiostoma belcheri]